LADLLSKPSIEDGDDPWLAVAQRAPGGPLPPVVVQQTTESPLPPLPAISAKLVAGGEFLPRAPTTIEETGLSHSEMEALLLKLLLNCGALPGRDIAQHINLPFGLVEGLLRQLKENLLVVYKGFRSVTDYMYELTETGSERARRFAQRCTYFGTAPVSLHDYIQSIIAQSVTKQHPRLRDLRKAFGDLVINETLLCQIGQAVNSGLGLFLHGAPGNGKTSIAERIIKAFGECIWMPRAISIYGETVRLFDPSTHDPLPSLDEPGSDDSLIDRRWVRVRRPTVVVGGELTMDNLEITTNPATGISEAPLQMKANCGTLLIDDFGRQRVSAAELLNRWIVPLERRYDFLNLANGRKIQVPFDQLIIFSTNLEPRQLVDEAFLRRIPYKIDVADPTEAEFRQLFRDRAAEIGVRHQEAVVDYLIEKHYRGAGRGFRFCHPRDLLHQIRTYCDFLEQPPELTHQSIDAAVRNYFAVMYT
jgi:predicted ATPase with chaperone activity